MGMIKEMAKHRNDRRQDNPAGKPAQQRQQRLTTSHKPKPIEHKKPAIDPSKAKELAALVAEFKRQNEEFGRRVESLEEKGIGTAEEYHKKAWKYAEEKRKEEEGKIGAQISAHKR